MQVKCRKYFQSSTEFLLATDSSIIFCFISEICKKTKLIIYALLLASKHFVFASYSMEIRVIDIFVAK